MNNHNRNWYLIYTKPRNESLAREHLERQGYETCLPLLSRTSRRRGRYQTVIEPCFPRYLFINLNTATDNWAPIRSTIGVSRMVTFGGLPAQVPGDLVAQLRANEDEHGLQRWPEPDDFAPGTRVTIIEGPFAGYEGIFQARKGHERAAILLDIVGRNTLATLDIHNLKPAGT